MRFGRRGILGPSPVKRLLELSSQNVNLSPHVENKACAAERNEFSPRPVCACVLAALRLMILKCGVLESRMGQGPVVRNWNFVAWLSLCM
jgi:hypothetical protein